MNFPIILSGASGVGKTVLGKLILAGNSSLVESISCTTREPRNLEENGRDYHFISEEEFLARIDANEFIEWAKVHDKYYGTPVNWIKETLLASSVFSVLDVQGGLQMRDRIPETCLIFLVPPSMKELEDRLRKRDADSEDSIVGRLETAKQEHKVGLAEYEYVVVNDKIEVALSDVLACIRAHHLKRSKIRNEGVPDGKAD